LGVVTVELVVEGFLEPCAPNFIVDEKTKYDETKSMFGPRRNARMYGNRDGPAYFFD